MNNRNQDSLYHSHGHSTLASFTARGMRALSSQAGSQVLIIVAIILSIILLIRV